MVKLFYSPTSCGAASFISAHAIGLNLDCEQVNIQTHKTNSGQDFYHINPKGNVPCIVLDDGTILNENVACLQYIADQVSVLSTNKIAPLNGTQDRYILMNCLSFIASELHTSIGGLFAKNSEEITGFIRNKVSMKLTFVENVLLKGGKDFLVWSDTASIADFYLYVILSWCPGLNVSLSSYPRCQAFFDRMASSNIVKEAQMKMSTNPSCVMGESGTSFGGKVSETIKPAVDKVSDAMSSTAEFTKDKFSALKDKFNGPASSGKATEQSKPIVEDAENKRPINSL